MFRTFNFIISIDDKVVGGFSKASGVERSIEIETYREGGNNQYEHQLPKYAVAQRLVLERGLLEDVDNDEIINWFKDCINGRITRKNIFISVINKPRVPNQQIDMMKTWMFAEAYPVRWSGPELNAMGSEIAFERIEFVYNRVEES